MSGVLSTENGAAPGKRRGGFRLGAGRKKSKERRYDPSHAKRPELSFNVPVHVMLRTVWSVLPLRQRVAYEAIRRALAYYIDGASFRVVHISIQNSHLHLIVEAANEKALSRGMQSFAIRAARLINAAFDREGKVFAFRYKARQIRDARYARNVIAYVLNNWRRHREDFNERRPEAHLDAFSSAISFGGWLGAGRYRPPDGYKPLPVSAPRTGLMKSGWQLHGLIDPFELPGPLA